MSASGLEHGARRGRPVAYASVDTDCFLVGAGAARRSQSGERATGPSRSWEPIGHPTGHPFPSGLRREAPILYRVTGIRRRNPSHDWRCRPDNLRTMSEPGGAPEVDPALDPAHRAAVVDLLGALAYGELTAFSRLAADADLAPSLSAKAALARFAVTEFRHFELLRGRLEAIGRRPRRRDGAVRARPSTRSTSARRRRRGSRAWSRRTSATGSPGTSTGRSAPSSTRARTSS